VVGISDCSDDYGKDECGGASAGNELTFQQSATRLHSINEVLDS